MDFDWSGMKGAFDKMRQRAESQGKDMATAQGQDFLKEAKKQGQLIAPTPEELTDTAKKLKWRLKRKPGVSPWKELARRIRARGTFGRGWFIEKITSERFRIRLWIKNKSTESELVDQEKKVSDKAEKITGGGFKSRLEKLAETVCNPF